MHWHAAWRSELLSVKFHWFRIPEWLSRFVLLGSLTGLLVACATTVPSSPGTPPVAAATQFSLSGRLSVRDGQQVDIAGISWHKGRDEESISLRSPLGSEVARIWRGQDGLARLKTSDEERIGADIDTLVSEALRSTVPLRALAWWIQGRSEEGTPLVTSQFDHDGWLVSVEDYPQSISLPVARRITARKGDIALRLVIDEWTARP